jgi:1-deoxy-D-xylulose-5-phosphate synthase
MSSLLATLRTPADLRSLSLAELEEMAHEVRTHIIQTVSLNGGHLGGPLGVVELAIALHYVFDSPHDRLIWDIDHQVYPHKLLTGRAEQFHTLRTEGGLSGYPNPAESPHDPFTSAHASVATSLALGLAVGDRLCHRQARCVAVVGDGALSAGVAYEALNHAGALHRPLLLVLNDNGMSSRVNWGVGLVSQLGPGGGERSLAAVGARPAWPANAPRRHPLLRGAGAGLCRQEKGDIHAL